MEFNNLVVGDSGVGKTALTNLICHGAALNNPGSFPTMLRSSFQKSRLLQTHTMKQLWLIQVASQRYQGAALNSPGNFPALLCSSYEKIQVAFQPYYGAALKNPISFSTLLWSSFD